jgi:hypothetical protein
MKDSVYEELECVVDKFPKYAMKILLGDFNRKVSRADIVACRPVARQLPRDKQGDNSRCRQKQTLQWTVWVAMTLEPKQTLTQQEKSCVSCLSVPRGCKRDEI